MLELERFFRQLGLDEKEVRVLMAVIRLGAQPTSVIAKHAKLDRTTTYRLLLHLFERKLLAQSTQKGVTVFYLEKLSDIEHYLEKKRRRLEELQEEFDILKPQLSALRSSVQALPRIQIYEGYDRLENFYRDIIDRALEQQLLLIRILGSNTFSQQLEQKGLGKAIKKFEKDLKTHAVQADILIAQGNLTREWLTHLNSFADMERLPAAGGATNVILVGESVFMVSFRDFPVGVRIDHPDIAQTFHFLFDISQKSAK
jgi:sugar-specific transcriptional regulator TrmB